MTGVDDAAEPAVDAIVSAVARELAIAGPSSYPTIVAALGRYTGALAEAGLLAPAPQPTKWWRVMGPDSHLWAETSSESDARSKMRPGDTLYRLWETRPAGRWLPVDHDDADDLARNCSNTVVLARDVAAAEEAGYPRHRWCVVTPRNIKIGPRGMRAHYVVAVDLTADELREMLLHDSVAPAFVIDGDPQVLHVTAEGRDE